MHTDNNLNFPTTLKQFRYLIGSCGYYPYRTTQMFGTGSAINTDTRNSDASYTATPTEIFQIYIPSSWRHTYWYIPDPVDDYLNDNRVYQMCVPCSLPYLVYKPTLSCPEMLFLRSSCPNVCRMNRKTLKCIETEVTELLTLSGFWAQAVVNCKLLSHVSVNVTGMYLICVLIVEKNDNDRWTNLGEGLLDTEHRLQFFIIANLKILIGVSLSFQPVCWISYVYQL